MHDKRLCLELRDDMLVDIDAIVAGRGVPTRPSRLLRRRHVPASSAFPTHVRHRTVFRTIGSVHSFIVHGRPAGSACQRIGKVVGGETKCEVNLVISVWTKAA
jgi:hypothetical protein